MLSDQAGTAGVQYAFEPDVEVTREELDKACAEFARKMRATELKFRGELIQVAKEKVWFWVSKKKRMPRD